VELPDGRTGFVERTKVMNFDDWNWLLHVQRKSICSVAKTFLGLPYYGAVLQQSSRLQWFCTVSLFYERIDSAKRRITAGTFMDRLLTFQMDTDD